MRVFVFVTLCLLALGLVIPTSATAQQTAPDPARSEVCVPYGGGDLVLRRGTQAIPVSIDDFLAPGGPSGALCCGACVGTECTGCVNLPTFSSCVGVILACPEGEILIEDGSGGCA